MATAARGLLLNPSVVHPTCYTNVIFFCQCLRSSFVWFQCRGTNNRLFTVPSSSPVLRLKMLAISQRLSASSSQTLNANWIPRQCRAVSNSPYGRTHVWKRRPPVLPNPMVPKFPQKVIRSDGTSFTHWTTSPRSLVRLTRDTTNNPIYNTGRDGDRSVEEETGSTGRLGRFNRKFEEFGADLEDITWMDDLKPDSMQAPPAKAKSKETKANK